MRDLNRTGRRAAFVVGALLLAGSTVFGQFSRGRRSSGSEAKTAAATVSAVADERSNSIVVIASEEALADIESLIVQIDVPTEEETSLEVFPLRYALAEEMADIITSVFATEDAAGSGDTGRRFGFAGFGGFGGFRAPQTSQQADSGRRLDEAEVTAVADVRTNSVIVSASTKSLAQVRALIEKLDSDPAKDLGVHVYRLQNADVEQVLEILEGMFEEPGSTSSSSSGARTGTRTTATQYQTPFGGGTRGGTSGNTGRTSGR